MPPTSKKVSPALYTSMSRLSDPLSRIGSGASSVSEILEWWAYSDMVNAFVVDRLGGLSDSVAC
jgi:hypothetical protein